MPRPFLGGGAARLHDRPHARRVDGGRLLHEDVLARLDRGAQVLGPEVGRRGEDHVVDLRHGEQLLVRVEADEAALLGDVEVDLTQVVAAAVDPVTEHVRQGDDLDAGPFDPGARLDPFDVVADVGVDRVVRRADRVEDRAGAAPAAADEADLHAVADVARAGVDQRSRQGDRARRDRAGFQETSPRASGDGTRVVGRHRSIRLGLEELRGVLPGLSEAASV